MVGVGDDGDGDDDNADEESVEADLGVSML